MSVEKVAIITAGGSGMGAAAARRLAAEGFKAPGVVVSYTTDPEIQSSKKFLALGLQTASGVPLQCDEGPDFRTFRLGLFGLDKWHDVPATVARLEAALQQVAPVRESQAA